MFFNRLSFLRLLLLALLPIILFSCSKDSGGAFFSATIGGKKWEAVVRVTTHQNGTFLLTGTSIGGEVLIITLLQDQPGTYNLSMEELGFSALYKKSVNSTYQDSYVAVSGTVVLTEVTDDRVSGTFQMELTRLTENLHVESGKFGNLQYTLQ
jgi:hypothetical protein